MRVIDMTLSRWRKQRLTMQYRPGAQFCAQNKFAGLSKFHKMNARTVK